MTASRFREVEDSSVKTGGSASRRSTFVTRRHTVTTAATRTPIPAVRADGTETDVMSIHFAPFTLDGLQEACLGAGHKTRMLCIDRNQGRTHL